MPLRVAINAQHEVGGVVVLSLLAVSFVGFGFSGQSADPAGAGFASSDRTLLQYGGPRLDRH